MPLSASTFLPFLSSFCIHLSSFQNSIIYFQKYPLDIKIMVHLLDTRSDTLKCLQTSLYGLRVLCCFTLSIPIPPSQLASQVLLCFRFLVLILQHPLPISLPRAEMKTKGLQTWSQPSRNSVPNSAFQRAWWHRGTICETCHEGPSQASRDASGWMDGVAYSLSRTGIRVLKGTELGL